MFIIVLYDFGALSYRFYMIFMDKHIDLVPSASCCFLLVFGFPENPYQMKSKCFGETTEDPQEPHKPPGRATTPQARLGASWAPCGPSSRDSNAKNSYKYQNPQK